MRPGPRSALLAAVLAAVSSVGYAAHAAQALARTVTRPVRLVVTKNPALPVGQGVPVYLAVAAVTTAGAPVSLSNADWTVAAGGRLEGTSGAGATFTAGRPGTYRVRVRAAGRTATLAVTVHGPPEDLELTPARLDLPTDGASATVQVRLTDASGVLAGDFYGRVTVTDSAGQLCASGGPNRQIVDLVDGTGKFQICAAAEHGAAKDVVRASALGAGIAGWQPLRPVPDVRYGSVHVTNVPPVVSRLAVQPDQGDPPYLSAKVVTSAGYLVTALDQAGNLWGSPPAEVTVTLTGPGSLSATGRVRQRVLTTPTQGDAFTVFSVRGKGGPIGVTITAPGAVGTAFTVHSYDDGAAAGLTLAATGRGVTRFGMPYTLYTATLVDGRGQPMAEANDRITLSDNAAAQPTDNPAARYYGRPGASLLYWPVPPDSAPLTFADQFMAPPPPVLYMTYGQAQFAVATGAAGDLPVTIKARDVLHGYTATAIYAWQTGPPAGVWLTPDRYFASPLSPSAAVTTCPPQDPSAAPCPYSVLAGSSVAYGAQLVDGDGNPVGLADVPIQFSAGSEGASVEGEGAYATLDTGPAGRVTARVAEPEAGVAATVMAQIQGSVPGVSATLLVLAAGEGPPLIAVSGPDYAVRVAVAGPSRGALVVGRAAEWTATADIADGQPLPSSGLGRDVLAVTSSNPKVLSLLDATTDTEVASAFVAPTAAPNGHLTWAMPSLQPRRPGSAVLTVTDVSNPTKPTARVSFTVRR